MTGPRFKVELSLQVRPSQRPAHRRRQEAHQDPGRALATGMCLYSAVVVVLILAKNQVVNQTSFF